MAKKPLDYTDFARGKRAEDPAKQNIRWWILEGDEVADSITAVLGYLFTVQSDRRTQLMIGAGLYSNSALIDALKGVGQKESTVAQMPSIFKTGLTYNLCSSVVDTVVSRISKTKPRVLFLTNGADYRTQRKAQDMTVFVDGVFYEQNAYDLGVEVFRDSGVFDSGIIKVFPKNGRVAFERVLPSELWVDTIDALHRNPTQMYQTKNIDKERLIVDFATDENGKVDEKMAEKIRAASGPKGDLGSSLGIPTIADTCVTREAWHLPSGPDAEDGRHVIAIENCVLLDEPYEKDHFPFVIVRYSKRLVGFFGAGLCEQLAPLQKELNSSLWTISRSFALMGSFKVFIENGSKVVKSHLNNLLGTIVNYTGTMPQYVTPPPVAEQLFRHVQDTINRGYQLAGVSQLTASSLKPAGIDSGKGLRTLIENEGDRFIPVQRAYEQMYVDLAKLSLEVIADITKNGKRKYAVKAPKNDSFVQIDWKDISLDPTDYAIKAYPTNALSEEPEGRFQDIQELVQAGLMTPQEGRRLLNYPDLKSVSSLDNAILDLLHKQMDGIIFDDEPAVPEPEDNLDEALKIGLETYAWARKMDVEEKKQSMLRQYIQAVQTLKTAQNPPAPAGGAGAPGGVGAPQASAPVSPAPNPMLPNAPGTGGQ